MLAMIQLDYLIPFWSHRHRHGTGVLSMISIATANRWIGSRLSRTRPGRGHRQLTKGNAGKFAGLLETAKSLGLTDDAANRAGAERAENETRQRRLPQRLGGGTDLHSGLRVACLGARSSSQRSSCRAGHRLQSLQWVCDLHRRASIAEHHPVVPSAGNARGDFPELPDALDLLVVFVEIGLGPTRLSQGVRRDERHAKVNLRETIVGGIPIANGRPRREPARPRRSAPA